MSIHDPKHVDDVAGRLREAIEAAEAKLPTGYGVTMFVFPMNQPAGENRLWYISNAQRDDMIKVIREWLTRQPQIEPRRRSVREIRPGAAVGRPESAGSARRRCRGCRGGHGPENGGEAVRVGRPLPT